MKVYQLKVKNVDYYLEPVFKTREDAIRYSDKYNCPKREFEIAETILDVETDYIYRIKYLDEEGYMLSEKIYESFEGASAESENNIIVKENILSGLKNKYELVEV